MSQRCGSEGHCFVSISLWRGLYCRSADKPVYKHKHWRSECPTCTISHGKSCSLFFIPSLCTPYSRSCMSGDKAAQALPGCLDDISTVFLPRPNASCLSRACRSGKSLKMRSYWFSLLRTLKTSHGWTAYQWSTRSWGQKKPYFDHSFTRTLIHVMRTRTFEEIMVKNIEGRIHKTLLRTKFCYYHRIF